MIRQSTRGALGGWILVGLMVGTTHVQAALIAYEGFDYPADGSSAIHDRDGGFGWDSAWINLNADFNHLTQDGVSLESPAFPFPTSGGRVAGSGGAARRVLAQPFDLSQDDTIYVSFLFRKEDTGDGGNRNVELGLSTSGGGTHAIRLGSTSGHRFFLTSTSAGDLGPDVEFGITYFLVLKGVAVADGTDQFFAKIYHPNDPSPTEEPVSWDMVRNVPASQANLTLADLRLAIGTAASGAIDEIRVGRTFASVAIIPEPGSVVIAVMGMVSLMWRPNAWRRNQQGD